MITSLTSPWIATLLTSWILVTSWNSFLARSFESSCHSQSTKYLPKARRQILLDLTLPTEWQTSRPYTVQKHHPHLKGNTYDQPRLGVSPLRPAMKKPWCFFFWGGWGRLTVDLPSAMKIWPENTAGGRSSGEKPLRNIPKVINYYIQNKDILNDTQIHVYL